MGVCRFFQQGSCRFGTKCHNEHFDVKQYLKTDIESGLNGKMWPFSVYGPFKDKPNLPNFIEDQSFEEVRFQAYESRRQNCFDQFHLQFSREVHEATNKMKLLLQTTPQTIDVMIKLYEIPEQAQSAANTNNNNPFGFAANNNAVQSTGSIFSKPTLGAGGAGNIFGGATAANGSNANSIFGGGSNATNTNNNIFGAATSTNIFTQQQQQQQQQLFGQQQQQQQAFGQQPFGQQQQQQPGNLFGQQMQQQPQQNNLFGQAQATADIFAQPSPFGQTAAFAPQQQQQAGNIFGQAAVAPQQQNTGNIFAQAAGTQPPNGFFGQAAFQQPQQQQQQQLLQQQHQQQQQGSQPATYTSSIYSRLEDLTAEEIAAFKAEQFLPGQVPFKPPPRELC